jgi:hypothetical protein
VHSRLSVGDDKTSSDTIDSEFGRFYKKKAGIWDSGLVDQEMVAGVRFELTTFGL